MMSCPTCRRDQTETSTYCSACGAALKPELLATVTQENRGSPAAGSDHASTSGSSHHGQFLPGTKVADRYRIVSLVGRGGMGEVYRADDLKLGHTVALKFLPEDLANDPKRLEYFHSEVRLTRQISHPNVCRVYDIGEYNGQHFLSMEYIDGEDLSLLLRRIGKIPHSKGVQIAQQLCAGLAAAHDRGVLHRDLKPANVMIDGRGQVRITDFGLARLAGQENQGEIVGTPAYMAPEQLTHGEATIQSDLFALGLILSEIFTGKAVLKPGSIPDLIRSHEESLPQSVATTDDIDPNVQRIIRRCLERQAHERPASARAVAAGLPGGDPLAAALAAGETPSPEMVAASGDAGHLSLKSAGICLAMALIGLASLVPIVGGSSPTKGLDSASQGYATLAQKNILGPLGLDDTDSSRDWGFLSPKVKPKHMEFWYRQSPQTLIPFIDSLKVMALPVNTLNNPSPLIPGMVSLRLHPDGSLRELLAVPSNDIANKREKDVDALVWLLKQAQLLDKSATSYEGSFSDAPRSDWTPPVYADKTWSLIPNQRDTSKRVDIAELNGEIVFFHVVDESAVTALTYSSLETRDNSLGPLLSVLITLLALILGWRNIRAGRSDLRGALRLALLIFIVNFTEFALGSVLAAGVLWTGLLLALAAATRIWIYYVALEPLARRYWPEMLVTWSRALNGRVQDPAIGRDILYGTTIGILFTLLAFGPLGISPETNPSTLCGTRFLVAQLARGVEYAFRYSLYIAMAMVLVRAAVGNKWLPVIAGTCIVFAWHPPGLFDPLWNVAIAIYEKEWAKIQLQPNELAMIVGYCGYYAVVAILLARWGILAASSFMLCHDFFRNYPWSADFAGPDLPGCVFAIAGIVLCASYGFFVSLGGRAAFISR